MTRNQAKRTDYWGDLNRLLDKIFDWCDDHDYTWYDMAIMSGLSYSTIYNLGERITVFPQLRTVMLLTKGVGYTLHLDNKIKLKIKKVS